MRIAGEIVNSRSAAADLTQSRSTRSATRRLDTKAGDSYCTLSPARPFGVHRQILTLSEELPKKRRRTEVLVSSNWQPWCPSAGTFSNNDLGFLTSGAIGIRIAYPRASGPGRLGRRASSSISTLPQMGWSKGNRLDLAQIGRMFKS